MKNKVNLGVLLALLSGLLWSLNTLLFSILIQPEGNNIIIFTIISALYNKLNYNQNPEDYINIKPQ